MNKAFYYPFTAPKHSSFFKTALFLWDSVDFIVPYRSFRPDGLNQDQAAAWEIISNRYVPTMGDQERAHEEFVKICNSRSFDELHFNVDDVEDGFGFYPQKFAYKTWNMLSDLGFAKVSDEGGHIIDATSGQLFGHYMMSVLAMCCSGEGKRLVTDDYDPYRAVSTMLVDKSINDGPSDWHGKLLSLSLAGPDFSDVPLSEMVKLRSREDQLFRELRQNFLSEVDAVAMLIKGCGENPNVIGEVIKDFVDKMERDLRELKRCLNRSAQSLILSKSFGVSVLVHVVGAMLPPFGQGVAGIVGIGGLKKELNDYNDRRRNILCEHPSAWLYSGAGPKFPLS